MTTNDNLPLCKFQFDDGPVWTGFSHGSKWNGFDNVAVTRTTLDAIVAWTENEEDKDMFREIEPMENGLYSLGWGFATQIVDEAAMSVFYTSDGEQDGMMPLDELLRNFAVSGGDPVNVVDLVEDLESRGWHTGRHEFGQFLVLSFEKFALMPDALDAYYAARKPAMQK
jgi:hypothetical protein